MRSVRAQFQVSAKAPGAAAAWCQVDGEDGAAVPPYSMRARCLSAAMSLAIVGWVACVAQTARAQSCSLTEGSRTHSLWTFVVLDALALTRHTDPTPQCHQVYVELDHALDRLIDTSDWQHLAWQFSRSGLYDTLDALVSDACDEDLSHDPPDESALCRSLRAQGRCQLEQIEQSRDGQRIIHSSAMDAFHAYIQVGKATGCLSAPNGSAFP